MLRAGLNYDWIDSTGVGKPHQWRTAYDGDVDHGRESRSHYRRGVDLTLAAGQKLTLADDANLTAAGGVNLLGSAQIGGTQTLNGGTGFYVCAGV